MLVLHNDEHLRHNPAVEYYDGEPSPYAEQPQRLVEIVKACRDLGLVMREVTTPASEDDVAALHGEHYIRYLREKCAVAPEGGQVMPSVFIMDTYTPLTPGTYKAALMSAGIALEAADVVRDGEDSTAYALCRPPGHHAEEGAMAGYCYFNNAALAAEALTEGGKTVAVLDIDYHHGNGTQRLFYDRNDVFYVSLHADPTEAFPYVSGYSDEIGVRRGEGFNLNIPLPADTTPATYLEALDTAIDEVNMYAPDYVVLSLGFDTYEHDPIAGLGIDEGSYTAIGARIAKGLRQPTAIIQEGGYKVDKLGELAKNFLTGYNAHR